MAIVIYRLRTNGQKHTSANSGLSFVSNVEQASDLFPKNLHEMRLSLHWI